MKSGVEHWKLISLTCARVERLSVLAEACFRDSGQKERAKGAGESSTRI